MYATLRELINAELIIAELIFAGEGVKKKSAFCGINFCGFDVLRRFCGVYFCGVYFCGYEIKTVFLMLYIHIFLQIKPTIEK